MLQTAFRPSCMNRASVFEWYKRFKEARESVWDDERCARSKEVNTPELIGQMLYFDLRPGPKMRFQGDTPEGSDTFQWPVIERDRVGGLRLMIWDKVKVPLCH